MRITLSLLFVFGFQLLAVETDAQNVVNFSKNIVSVGELIEQIEEQTDFLVLFRNREVDTERTVRLKNKTEQVDKLLNSAFENTEVSYEIENNYILLSKVEHPDIKQQEKKLVNGKVLDERGEEVIGANITEKGTTNGTITDYDGNFSLSVTEDAVLQISYIGYNTVEIPVTGKTMLAVTLTEDAQSLNEVIVVGYGTQRARDVTSSVANVSMKGVKEMPVTGLDQALTGQVAGVTISTSNGIPGVAPRYKYVD